MFKVHTSVRVSNMVVLTWIRLSETRNRVEVRDCRLNPTQYSALAGTEDP